MEATTTRASTVIRSIPTREIRTQASITMPLSSTRSSTSIRLEPPETRSTAIEHPPDRNQPKSAPLESTLLALFCSFGRHPRRSQLRPRTGTRQLPPGRFGQNSLVGEVRIELPPIQPDFFRLVHRTDQQANADGQ